MKTRHFLSLLDFSTDELHELLHHAIDVKKRLKQGILHTPLTGKVTVSYTHRTLPKIDSM